MYMYKTCRIFTRYIYIGEILRGYIVYCVYENSILCSLNKPQLHNCFSSSFDLYRSSSFIADEDLPFLVN